MTDTKLVSVAVGLNSNSSLSLILHPLPLLNISDFFTRAKLSSRSPPYAGLLFGSRSSHEITIENAFEMLFTENNLDHEYLVSKRDLYKITFPKHDLLGWFHVISQPDLQPTEQSLLIHEQVLQESESPVLVIINPEPNANNGQLPCKAYEAVYKGLGLEFQEIPVRIDTKGAERVAVDDIMRGKISETNGLGLQPHLTTQTNAMRMFHSRLAIVRDYIDAVRSGALPADRKVLRDINAFVSRLPDTTQSKTQRSMDDQELEVLIAGLLSVLSKAEVINGDLISKRLVFTSERHHEPRERVRDLL